jgi:hypothetical protein
MNPSDEIQGRFAVAHPPRSHDLRDRVVGILRFNPKVEATGNGVAPKDGACS